MFAKLKLFKFFNLVFSRSEIFMEWTQKKLTEREETKTNNFAPRFAYIPSSFSLLISNIEGVPKKKYPDGRIILAKGQFDHSYTFWTTYANLDI